MIYLKCGPLGLLRIHNVTSIKLGKKHFIIQRPFWLRALMWRVYWADGLNIITKCHKYRESWTVLKLGGEPLREMDCACSHDCCGHRFTRFVRRGFLWSMAGYAVNI